MSTEVHDSMSPKDHLLGKNDHQKGQLKDGGSRKHYSTGAMKEDQSATEGKGRYDLLPVTAIRRIAEIYRRGAEKYTKTIPVSIDQVLTELVMLKPCPKTVHNAIKIVQYMPKDYADLAMKKTYEQRILNMLNVNVKMLVDGSKPTENIVKITTEFVIRILKGNENIEREIDLDDLSSMELLLKHILQWHKNKGTFVQFVLNLQEKEALTSTMTIAPEGLEDCCVPNVTKHLACLMTILKVFSEQSDTSPIRKQLVLTENGFVRYHEGCRNWELGLPLSRFLDSAKRHLDQYHEGMEDEDHLAQATWNLLALLHTEEMMKRGILTPELDDLPSYMPTDADPGMWRQKDRFNGKKEKL